MHHIHYYYFLLKIFQTSFCLFHINSLLNKYINLIERLSYVDRAIIRLAVYELLETKTPASIIINEAIEITKEYSNLDDEAQSKFTNRLLDEIKDSLNRCE